MPNYRYPSPDCMRQSGNRYPENTFSFNNHSKDDMNLEYRPLAMAYVPRQNWNHLYEIEKGFQKGTIFEKLDKPFLGKGGCCK